MMDLRLFNESGIVRLERFIQDLRDGRQIALKKRDDILIAPALSEVVRPEAPIAVEEREFQDSKQAMDYLHGKLSGVDEIEHIVKNKYLWSWLALFYFHRLCPPGSNGRYKVGQSARWIPDFHRNRQFFHLLLGPYLAYILHRNNPRRARILFCHRFNQSNEAVIEIGCRQELITCNAVVEAAGCLYVGEDGKFKRGIHGKSGLRRFIQVVQQFSRTWDLYSMPTETLLGMLPKEFDRWIGGRPSSPEQQPSLRTHKESLQQKQMVLQYVRSHNRITREETAALCKLDSGQASRLLRGLVVSRKLKMESTGRGACYVGTHKNRAKILRKKLRLP